MRRVLLGLALAILSVAGTASADTFRVLPSAPTNLPSAATPNQPGQITAPTPISATPAVAQSLNFQQLVALWQGAGSAYGIPWEVLASINKIESNFGRNMGPSSAGAVGWMQFMPSTWDRWGLDANGDGVADPWNPQDAIYAAARYLAAAGGTQDLSRAVLAYNHAQWYVDEAVSIRPSSSTGSRFHSTARARTLPGQAGNSSRRSASSEPGRSVSSARASGPRAASFSRGGSSSRRPPR